MMAAVASHYRSDFKSNGIFDGLEIATSKKARGKMKQGWSHD